MNSYADWFTQFSGNAPRTWQVNLGEATRLRSQLIRVPTGYGKTLGVLGAWLYNRVHRRDEDWPRRLVWTLPMRVLVEQTATTARESLSNLGLLWDGVGEHARKVGVHILMGGTDAGGEWNLFPEDDAILIGTQDMLLSRGLNRGYGAGRARWPLEFGLLSHDALWVYDEVQLMDVGIATGAQLQAYLEEDASRGFRPRASWWMSATLQSGWLKSVDTADAHRGWAADVITLPPADRTEGLAAIPKSLSIETIPAKSAPAFARRCADEHAQLADGEHGRITLVVCNTVARACETYRELGKLGAADDLVLVHSRFRPAERMEWRPRFLSRNACRPGINRIIVATQVVEAGVDISAGVVITEAAPWSSLVQRFGRCARYGGIGRVIVIDRGRDEKTAPPYEPHELDAAWSALERLASEGRGVGIAVLEAFEDRLGDDGRAALYPYQPDHLLLRREFDELFDTTPDLTGADLDISRFIRSGDERDVQVFRRPWRQTGNASADAPSQLPSFARRALQCSVPRRARLVVRRRDQHRS